jgi:hypothetical protein
MNCEELQRYLLAVPTDRDETSVARHIERCTECRRFAADLARFERLIEAAALSIEAPEGLAARVLLRDQKPRADGSASTSASGNGSQEIRSDASA